jgi:endonuclease III related protein
MIVEIYKKLLEAYGYQGWFPLLEIEGSNPTKTGSVNGYHPKDYSYPRTDLQRFEICVGLILTQNTSWLNVEKALLNLNSLRLIEPKAMLECADDVLKDLIKPAGYFNQKCKKLKEFCAFFLNLKSDVERGALLNIWGVGPETADSILLYAYHKPVFVIDAYTKRIFSRLGFEFNGYDDLQAKFHSSLEMDHKLFNEFHALIVEHAKRSCMVKPKCSECVLNKVCKKCI